MSVARLPDMRSTAMSVLAATLISTGAMSLTGCTGPEEGDDPEDNVFVDDSKADDFFSTSAAEYVLEGKSTVVLDASMASLPADQRLAAAKKLVGYKQIAIAWFVTQYLVSKEHDAPNAEFGGFAGLAKAGAYSDLGITERADKITFDFTFRQIAAGGKNLMQQLPLRSVNGVPSFDLEIGKPTNAQLEQLETNNEWYRQAPWSGWNPASVPVEQKEKITFGMKKERVSNDAFFDMAALTADGKLDIDVYFGWDYHSEYHLKHSQSFFTWLKAQGFIAPVASWDDMKHTTGAFKRSVKADGKNVNVEVRMYFGKPGTATDPDTDAGGKVLEDLARASLLSRDVVVYSGHSGPFYGFALANWKKTSEGDLDDSEMRTIPLRAEYQVVLAEGCDTYQIGEALKENSSKMGKNVDTITTMTFSNASSPATVQNFMSALLAKDSSGRLRPEPVSKLLTKLDSESWGFAPMYGIHGIDDNPTLVPFAHRASFGKACSSNADCGGPGNLCVGTSTTSSKKCTAACSADAGCGEGYACRNVASSSTNTIYGRACAKSL
jgi:hypothetical protein